MNHAVYVQFEEFGLDPLADFEDGIAPPPSASQGISPSISEGDGGGLRGSSFSDLEDENDEKERRKKQYGEAEEDDDNHPLDDDEDEDDDEDDDEEEEEESYVYTIDDFICDDFDSTTSTTTTDESDLYDSTITHFLLPYSFSFSLQFISRSSRVRVCISLYLPIYLQSICPAMGLRFYMYLPIHSSLIYLSILSVSIHLPIYFRPLYMR